MLLALVLVACGYDDTDLRADLDDLTGRVEALESQIARLNANLENVQTLVNKIDANVFVSRVETVSNGYRIHFSDGTIAEIKNGENGAPGAAGTPGAPGTPGAAGAAGKDGATIGIAKDTDGIYYWRLTSNGSTDWLRDDEGNKIPVSGVAPKLSVDAEGYWTVSYDDGKTYTRIVDADGEEVKAMQGSSLFEELTYDDDFVTIKMADGTQLQLPRVGGFGVTIQEAAETEAFAFGETKTFALEINGVEEIVLTKPDEWKAAVDGETLTVTAPAAEHAACAELAGVIKLICINAAGLTKVASLAVTVSDSEDPENPGTVPSLEIAIPTDFTASNIQRVIYEGTQVAEICLEYINTVDAQRTVIYPMGSDGKADLTKGIDATTGGTVVWNLTANTCTYTAGSGALTKVYYDSESGTLTTTAASDAVAATVEPDLLVDVRGSETETYKITKIGTQYWMAESLRTEFYTDGTAISTEWSNADGAYIYLGNERASYRTLYGTLYSGRTVMQSADNLAPEGWTLPEGADITALRTYLGDTPATKLKGTSGWTSNLGNNLTGFNALPGQYYAPINNGDDFGSTTPDVLFWTKSTGKDILSRDLSIFYYRLYNTHTRLICELDVSALAPSLHSQDFGHYVRCMRK